VQAVRGLKDVTHAVLRHRRLEVKLGDETPNALVLAQLFQTLADHKVTLITVRSVGMQTEQAYLDLVEKEDGRGFARLYQANEAA
jgi:ABC-2 type transport system ATP-binding protein